MPKGDGFWYDEAKLPRWAQERIAHLRDKAARGETLAKAILAQHAADCECNLCVLARELQVKQL